MYEVVYSPLEQNADIESGIELNNNDNNNDNNNGNNNDNDIINIKVLNKEKIVDITNISKNITIKELKERIHSLTDIEPQLQRLILGGKPLKPEDKTLSFYKIENGTTIHLFPIPVVTGTAVSTSVVGSAAASSSSSIAVASSSSIPSQPLDHSTTMNSLMFEPQVQQTCRAVKVWSIVLLVLSYMGLFNNTSYILSTGSFGNGILDSIVTLLDTCCSIGGIYVGQLGLLVTRNLDTNVANKYAKNLVLLACASIGMRLLWVLDVVSQMQQVVKNSAALHNNNHSPGPNGSTDDYSGHNKITPEMGENVVEKFTVQATIIALVIITAWINCAVRGVRLRNMIINYEQYMNPTTPNSSS